MVTINVLYFFLTVPWVDLQCAIEVFPDHTHLLFVNTEEYKVRTMIQQKIVPELIHPYTSLDNEVETLFLLI